MSTERNLKIYLSSEENRSSIFYVAQGRTIPLPDRFTVWMSFLTAKSLSDSFLWRSLKHNFVYIEGKGPREWAFIFP
jgi:hypothetical protein